MAGVYSPLQLIAQASYCRPDKKESAMPKKDLPAKKPVKGGRKSGKPQQEF